MVEVQELQHRPVATRPHVVRQKVVSAAQERVQKLEWALEVLGEDSGPEFQVLQNSLKKAKSAAQSVPGGVQLEQSLKFVERSEKRLRVLDEERAKEARLLEEAKQRVARLRSELAEAQPWEEQVIAQSISDLFTGELQRGSVVNRGSRLSSVMETLIDNAESSARSNHGFNPM